MKQKEETKAIEKKSMRDIVLSMEGELSRAMPKHMDPGRLIRSLLTELKLNPKLMQCTWQSVVGALFTAGQLGLEPVGGQCFFVPFSKSVKKGNQWTKELVCQFIIGYKGFAELFYRHESSLTIEFAIVKEGDFFEYEKGTAAFLRHKPIGKGKSIAYYTIAKVKNGGVLFEVMSHDDCLEHAKKFAKAWDAEKKAFKKGSSWENDKDSMCLKTTLRRLAKTLPLSFEIRRALEADESIRQYEPGVRDFMDMKNESWGFENETELPPLDEMPPAPVPQESKSTDAPIEITTAEKAMIQTEFIRKYGDSKAAFAKLQELLQGVTAFTDIKTVDQKQILKDALAATES